MAVMWDVFLPWLAFFCIVGLIFALIYMGMRRLGVTWWKFWMGMGYTFMFIDFFRFVYAEGGHLGVDWLWFSNGWVFSCMIGIVLGAVLVVSHVGAKCLGVTWDLFLKALAFCCFVGVVLWLAYGEVRSIGLTGIFLIGLALAILLKLLLGYLMRGFLMRERGDSVLRRSLWLLNGLVFSCIVGAVFAFAYGGAQRLGVDWLWFSNGWVFCLIFGFTSPFIYHGARCARVVGKAFFERVVFWV
ncbi:hypothetical protein [Bartonella taylorii]|uniref:hypothetical protein n=1 Tax=Bartonella taylorii TaxID=33046 RepID=UPI001ABB3B09|nr:hypothetical protein [Bartonella taylorii]